MPGDGRRFLDVLSENDEMLSLRSARIARTALHKGVTTLRDNGGRGIVTFSLRQAINEGLETGPRLNLCGKPLTTTGGHCWMMGGEADGF
jgi:imidazolonepropionase-like amidohydrolase